MKKSKKKRKSKRHEAIINIALFIIAISLAISIVKGINYLIWSDKTHPSNLPYNSTTEIAVGYCNKIKVQDTIGHLYVLI